MLVLVHGIKCTDDFSSPAHSIRDGLENFQLIHFLTYSFWLHIGLSHNHIPSPLLRKWLVSRRESWGGCLAIGVCLVRLPPFGWWWLAVGSDIFLPRLPLLPPTVRVYRFSFGFFLPHWARLVRSHITLHMHTSSNHYSMYFIELEINLNQNWY